MKHAKFLLVLLSLLALEAASLLSPFTTRSANLTSAKDTLQTSRISWVGRVKAPTVAGSAHVWIYTAASGIYNSISTANLAPGDSVEIGGTNSYTIATIVDADEFTLTTNLAVNDADDTDTIFFRSKPQHVVTFTTASAITDGFFQVLIPADATNSNDGNPDDGGFDFGSGSVTVTPTNATGYNFSNNAATPAGGTGCTAPVNYHCFEFHYAGTGGNGTAIELIIGNTNGATTPIAPGPEDSTSVGEADAYTVQIKNFTNGSDPETATATDQTNISIGLIEAVRVTATVDPTITFTITGVATAQTVCGTGSTTDVNTTTALNAPVAVPFGVMALNTFKTAAHLLTVSTNAQDGYAVTAIEDDQLGLGGGTTPFIPDTTCETGTCTHLAEETWVTATGNPGFGYSLGAGTGSTMEFSNGNVFASRQFPALAETEDPQRIMYSTGVSDSHTGYVCYRLAVDATQAAGDYENLITYTATATF